MSVKRVTARASLQKTTSGHILTAEQMFKFCKEASPSVNFVYITASEISAAHSKLEHQYLITETIPGTQSYHQYIPISNSTIKLKCVSCVNLISSKTKCISASIFRIFVQLNTFCVNVMTTIGLEWLPRLILS